MPKPALVGRECEPFAVRRSGRRGFNHRNWMVKRLQLLCSRVKTHDLRYPAIDGFQRNRAVCERRWIERISLQPDFHCVGIMQPTHNVTIGCHRLEEQTCGSDHREGCEKRCIASAQLLSVPPWLFLIAMHLPPCDECRTEHDRSGS